MPGSDIFCETCMTQDLVLPDNLSTGESSKTIVLGSVAAVRARISCPRCRFVTRCLESRQICGMDSILSLFDAATKSGQSNLHFTISADMPEPLFKRIKAYNKPYGATIRPFVNLNIVQQWLRLCNTHTICKSISGERETSSSSHVPLTFVDVNRYLLVQPPGHPTYVVLSYVWGSHPQDYSMVKPKSEVGLYGEDPIVCQMQPVRLVEQTLPQTLLDAIFVARGIGVQFLWVDALCIPQSDENIKAEQIENMDQIYQESVCAIIAVAGENSNAGLPGVSFPRSIVLNVERFDPHDNRIWTQEIEDFVTIVDESYWASRAWTLQEGMLSKRKLIFSENDMYFLCPSGLMSEATVGMSYEETTPPYSLDSSHLYSMPSSREPLGPVNHSLTARLYRRIVAVYSSRNLSRREDCLGAIKGILSLLERHDPAFNFFCGLPLHNFGMWLLWEESQGMHSTYAKSRPENWQAAKWPSWTWVAHWTPVEYRNQRQQLTSPLLPTDPVLFSMCEVNHPEIVLEDWVRSQRCQSGRRGIKHNSLGRIRLKVETLSVQAVFTDWLVDRSLKETLGVSTRFRSGPNGWLRLDKLHFGEIISDSVYAGTLYLLAVSLDAVTPIDTVSIDGIPLSTDKLEICLLLVFLNGNYIERIGLAGMRLDKFLSKAERKPFIFDGPVPILESNLI